MAAFEPPPFMLTPFDTVVGDRHAPKMLFLPDSTTSRTTQTANTLRDGLSKTLKAIPVLSGTVQTDRQGSFCVAAPWNTVDQILQLKDLSHEEGLDYQKIKGQGFPLEGLDVNLLLPLAGLRKREKPVLLVQINIIKGGYIVILSLNHGFMDGNGTAVVAKLWAACCRGEDPSPLITGEMIDRERLRSGWNTSSLGEIRSFVMSRNDERARQASALAYLDDNILDRLMTPWPKWMTSTKESQPTLLPQAQCEIFFFSKSKLVALKDMASLAEYNDGENTWISTNNALTALLGTCILSTIGEDIRSMDDSIGSLITMINIRRILDPPLPADFIGNALSFSKVSAPLHTIDSTPEVVAKVAHTIRKQIQEASERSIRETIAGYGRAFWEPPPPSEHIVRVTSWATQRFYDLDWGNAVGTKIERIRRKQPDRYQGFGAKVIILPEIAAPHFEAEECGLEVALVDFWSEHMERLKRNELFMRFGEWRCK